MFTIRQPSTVTELSAGLGLLNSTFQSSFGAYPRELPHQLFLAFDENDGDKVVGTINLQVCRSPEETFEVEHFFECRAEEFYLGHRTDVGEVGRLVSTRPIITPYLFCAIALLAEKFDIQFFVSFNRRLITRLMRASYQFPVDQYSRPLRHERVRPEYVPYFCSPEDPVVVLTQPVANWQRRVKHLIAEAERDGLVEIVLPETLDQMRPLLESYGTQVH